MPDEEKAGKPGEPERSFKAGETEDSHGSSPKPAAGARKAAAAEATQRKAVDDADSRDAPPMRGPEGGVR